MQDSGALVLEVLRQDGHLAMSIFGEEELGEAVRYYSRLPVSASEIDNLCQEVVSILNKAKAKGNVDLIDNLKKASACLWDQLLTKPVKDKLLAAQTEELVLVIDEDLINIPWELLYDGKDFMCLKFNLGRLVRTKERRSSGQYRSANDSLKMLILVNPTRDLTSAYLEGVYIKNQFDRRRRQMKIDFKSTHIDKLYVKGNLRDYDIVHFAGHCAYDPQDSKNTGWVLSDGIFTTQSILALGENMPMPTLIFSHACQSAKAASDFIDSDYQAKTYSLAAAFLFAGVRLYIGTIRRIEDSVSLTFAEEFYTQLIRGKTIGECMRKGRLRLIDAHGILSLHWTSYLLYGDPNFAMFRLKPKSRLIRLKKRVWPHKRFIISLLSTIIAISLCIYLYIWLPTINPNTYFLFLKSRGLFLKGRNQEAIASCNLLIKKEPLFLEAYSLLGDTYDRLGRRDEAIQYYFAHAIHSERKHDTKNLASAYIRIGWAYQNRGDYPKALDFYNKAIALSREHNDRLNEAVVLRKLAVWYIDKEDYDKALELLMKSSEINRARQYIYGHKYNLACDYFDIGLVFTNKDDFLAAKEFYKKSQAIFGKLKLKNELSDYYFNLGEIYILEKQYQKGLDCYMQGLRIDQAQDNKPSIASDYNMLGELYIEMGNPDEAERFFNQSILISKYIDAPLELACAFRNLGLLYKEKGHKDKARLYLRQAEEIYARIDTPDYQAVKQELLALE